MPSLGSLVSHDPDCKKMMGLALKNVTLTLFEDGKDIFEEQGEMLFTHFGVSGPLVLSASDHLRNWEKETYRHSIDLKPALDEQKQDTAAGVYSELAVEFFDNSGDDEELIYSLKCGAYVPGGGAVG